MKQISTTNAPAAIGPYSQALRTGNMMFVSGQIPVDPATGLMADTIEAQAAQSLTNLKNILAAEGLSMKNVIKTEVKSITTARVQTLYLDQSDVDKMAGKRVLIVDDVVSTGESLHALEVLVERAGGIIAGKMAILAEGDAMKRDDILYVQKLPLFDKNGEPIEG